MYKVPTLYIDAAAEMCMHIEWSKRKTNQNLLDHLKRRVYMPSCSN